MPFLQILKGANNFSVTHSNDERFSVITADNKLFVFDHKNFMMKNEFICRKPIYAVFYIQDQVIKEPLLMVVYAYEIDIL